MRRAHPDLDLDYLRPEASPAPARVPSERLAALLVIHLDRLKEVHETIGRRAGAVLLRNLAERWSAVLENDQKLTDLGGGEFAVLVPRASARRRARSPKSCSWRSSIRSMFTARRLSLAERSASRTPPMAQMTRTRCCATLT